MVYTSSQAHRGPLDLYQLLKQVPYLLRFLGVKEKSRHPDVLTKASANASMERKRNVCICVINYTTRIMGSRFSCF